MPKLDRSLFWKGILVFCLSLLGSAIMNILDIISPGFSGIGALLIVIIIILSGVIVQFLWTGIEKMLKWVKVPNRKNLKLKRIENSDESISLIIQNKEWRRSAIKVDEIKGFIKEPVESQNWMKLSPVGFQLEKRKQREIEFIFLDDAGTGFFIREYIDGKANNQHFTPGKYLFCVVLNYSYNTGGNGLLKWYDIQISCIESGKVRIKIEHTKQKE